MRTLYSFRGIGLRTAPGLLAETGDFRHFGHPHELMRDDAGVNGVG